MKLEINGEPREISGAENVAALVESLGLPAAAMLVEHNGIALRRDEWLEHRLADGDHLEIIQVAAGG